MPRYDYECTACGEAAERSRSIAHRDDVEPHTCGRGLLMRVPSTKAPGTAFKGSGWTQKSRGGRTQ